LFLVERCVVTARYYFSDDNLGGLVALLSSRPAGDCKILIGTDGDIDVLPPILARLTAQDRTVAEWVAAKIRAKELDIRAMKKANLPQGVDLTTYQG
jgi:hypothetical protein